MSQCKMKKRLKVETNLSYLTHMREPFWFLIGRYGDLICSAAGVQNCCIAFAFWLEEQWRNTKHMIWLVAWSLPSENEELGASPGGHAKGLIFNSFQLPLKGLVFKSIKRLLGVEKLGQDYINLWWHLKCQREIIFIHFIRRNNLSPIYQQLLF